MDESRHQKLANAAKIERIMTGFLEEVASQALAVPAPPAAGRRIITARAKKGAVTSTARV
jgi:hypothetical protein